MIQAHHGETVERQVFDESAERLLDSVKCLEMIEMFGIYIGNDGDVRG